MGDATDSAPTELSQDEWFLIAQEKDFTIIELSEDAAKLRNYVKVLKQKLKDAGVEVPDMPELKAPTDTSRDEEPSDAEESSEEVVVVTPSPPKDGTPVTTNLSPRQQNVAKAANSTSVVPPESRETGENGKESNNGKESEQRLADKAIAMLGDAELEQQSKEYLDEEKKRAMNEKAAKLVGSEKVLKKKLRDRFGSEIHREAKEMMLAKEKYERLKKSSGVLDYMRGSAGEAYLAAKSAASHAVKKH